MDHNFFQSASTFLSCCIDYVSLNFFLGVLIGGESKKLFHLEVSSRKYQEDIINLKRKVMRGRVIILSAELTNIPQYFFLSLDKSP